MTIEEAIKVLRSLYNVQRLDTLTREEMTAVAMAIRSLESWEKLIKFADSEKENNGTLRVHINDIKKFYKEIKNDR